MNREICVAKIALPDGRWGMRLCGESCEYRTPERDGSHYTGWYHTDESITDHHAVPKSWVA